MRKLMSIVLGLSLLAATAVPGFAASKKAGTSKGTSSGKSGGQKGGKSHKRNS